MAPIYDYKALSPQGKAQRGFVEAETPKVARAKLKKQGLMVTDIVEKKSSRAGKGGGGSFLASFSGRISGADVSLMTRQFASLVKANIPLVEALGALIEQTEKEKVKVILSQVRQDVNEGSSLAKAIAQHPRMFDTIFISMVEAGEASGTLGLVLLRLAELKEAQVRLRGKVTTAMTYPVLMMLMAFVLMIVIFTFVIPKLVAIFKNLDKPIPIQTQVLIFVSETLVNYWYLLLTGTVAAVVLFRRYIATPGGHRRWDAFKLRAPVFGALFRMISVTRFSHTMATLLGSGVPILTSMAIAKNLVGNLLIAEAIENARSNITEGQSIAEPLRRSGEFPPLALHMVAIGEKTGELPEMLKNVASTYEEQVNAKVESMTAMLEPLMIIGMGAVVAYIVMAVFLPLLNIQDLATK